MAHAASARFHSHPVEEHMLSAGLASGLSATQPFFYVLSVWSADWHVMHLSRLVTRPQSVALSASRTSGSDVLQPGASFRRFRLE